MNTEFRKNGKWLDIHQPDKTADYTFVNGELFPYDAVCSECDNWLNYSDEYNVTGNYCPRCGANMMNTVNSLDSK